jgi:hypothetical protein
VNAALQDVRLKVNVTLWVATIDREIAGETDEARRAFLRKMRVKMLRRLPN